MRICVDCRTFLEDGEACEPAHLVVALDDPQLCAAVWPAAPGRPEHVGRGFTASAQVSVLGLVVTILVCSTFSLCNARPGATLVSPGFWLFIAIIAAIVVPALIVEQLDKYGVSRRDVVAWLFPNRPRPRGVRAREVPRAGGAPGRASGEPVLTAPLTGRPCLAWAVTVKRSHEVLLRAARAATFRVALDNGGTVEIPAGRVDLHAVRPRAVDASAWLATFRPSGGRDPFPSDEGWEAIIAPGDEVAVLNELEPCLDADAPAPGYRETAPTVLRPSGRPVLRT